MLGNERDDLQALALCMFLTQSESDVKKGGKEAVHDPLSTPPLTGLTYHHHTGAAINRAHKRGKRRRVEEDDATTTDRDDRRPNVGRDAQGK